MPKKASGSDYLDFCKQYTEGAQIKHKKYGAGTVVSERAGMILVRFADGGVKSFSLAVLYEKSLTE